MRMPRRRPFGCGGIKASAPAPPAWRAASPDHEQRGLEPERPDGHLVAQALRQDGRRHRRHGRFNGH
jgi:hypothetical protein